MDQATPPPVGTPNPIAPPPSFAPPTAAGAEDKTVAILSYITLIGFIAAIIINSNKKTQLGAFHLRQMLGIMLTGFALGICQLPLLFIPILGWLCVFAAWVAMLVLWIMGLFGAIDGKMKPVPLLGDMYQKWFGSAFN